MGGSIGTIGNTGNCCRGVAADGAWASARDVTDGVVKEEFIAEADDVADVSGTTIMK